ncbi:MAG TPA: hypothetical protein VMV90_11175 [Rectinemataceae bacterium]|nr:hypothetical protein [Rectinemataceae bacterium]
MRFLRVSLALLLGFALSSAVFGLEAKEGLVRLVVNESNGRLSLYRLVDVAKSRYVALFYDQDPRTSFATLSIDGHLVRLGDDSDYRVSASRTDTGVRIEFRSAVCVVRELLDFARSEGSTLADGLRVTFELENVSDRDERLGLRYLLDTCLAEKSGIHFATDQRARITQETSIAPSSPDTWIETPGDKASFMVQLAGPGIDRPDQVILANWKRLSDAPWGFDVNPQRDFTLMPYSIDDSAMALYYEPALVSRGGVRRLSFVMGSFNGKGYPKAGASGDTEAIFGSTVLGASAPDKTTALETDMVAARDLIGRIDRALASGTPISADELAAWQKILDRLEERKKGY